VSKQKLTSSLHIIEKLQLLTEGCRGIPLFHITNAQSFKKFGNPLFLKRKEVDTNVVKNTIFHYNIECLLSDNTV